MCNITYQTVDYYINLLRNIVNFISAEGGGCCSDRPAPTATTKPSRTHCQTHLLPGPVCSGFQAGSAHREGLPSRLGNGTVMTSSSGLLSQTCWGRTEPWTPGVSVRKEEHVRLKQLSNWEDVEQQQWVPGAFRLLVESGREEPGPLGNVCGTRGLVVLRCPEKRGLVRM